MLGFYVLLEDPDANIIIALALHSALRQLGFFISHDLPVRYIADQPRPLATGEDTNRSTAYDFLLSRITSVTMYYRSYILSRPGCNHCQRPISHHAYKYNSSESSPTH